MRMIATQTTFGGSSGMGADRPGVNGSGRRLGAHLVPRGGGANLLSGLIRRRSTYATIDHRNRRYCPPRWTSVAQRHPRRIT